MLEPHQDILEVTPRAGELEHISLVSDLGKSEPDKTLTEWVNNHNQNGIITLTAPHVYLIMKRGCTEEIETLRRCSGTSLWVATLPEYHPSNLSGKFTHHFGSTVLDPVVLEVNVIPEYHATPLDEILSTPEGIAHQQTFYDTVDSPKTIRDVLESGLGLDAKKIVNYAPNQNSRGEYRGQRCVEFVNGGDIFNINTNGNVNRSGYSLGVAITRVQQD